MANRDFASITGALAFTWGPRVRRALNSKAVALMTLAASGGIERGTGKNVAWGVELDGEAAETYSDGADASSYTTNTQVLPVLSWGLYRANGQITKLALDAAGSSPAPGDLIRLAGRELVNKSRALGLKLGTDLFSGTGANVMTGLDSALDDDNTYAGVDRTLAANAKFRATVVDPGVATAITKALIRSDLSVIYDASGYAPDVAFCSTNIWNSIASLMDPNVLHQVRTDMGGAVVLNGGVQTIEFDGCTFVKDRLATAGRIYYLTREVVRVQVLPAVVVDELGEVPLSAPIEMTDDMRLPLEMSIEALAKTGAARKFSAYVTAQLKVEQPNACGIRLNVA